MDSIGRNHPCYQILFLSHPWKVWCALLLYFLSPVLSSSIWTAARLIFLRLRWWFFIFMLRNREQLFHTERRKSIPCGLPFRALYSPCMNLNHNLPSFSLSRALVGTHCPTYTVNSSAPGTWINLLALT